MPALPGAPPSVSTPAIETVAIPSLSATAPSVAIPTAPQIVTPTAPVAPVLETITTPADPTITLPEAPVLTSVAFPDTVSVSLPTFTQSFPLEPDLLIPTNTFDYQEGIVETPTLDKVQAKVEGDLDNGGYGIDSADEQALVDRARDRELQAAISAEESELRSSAARGFAVPPGVAAARIDAARQQARERISEVNREVMVNRAKLFRDARQAAMTTGIAVEAERLRYQGFRLERALNAQRFTAEFTINVFDAQVRKYNTRLQAYNTFIQGYASQIQAELGKVEIYRTEVQAAVEQQRAKQIEVELYNAIVNSSTVRVSLFESQVRAAGLKVDLERAKMEAFRSEVQAFAAQIDANQTEVGIFNSLINAEQAKVAIFNTQVDAHRSQVQAASIENEVRNRDVTLSIQKSQLELAGYEQEVRTYTATIAAEDARVRGLLGQLSEDNRIYAAALSAWEGLTRAGTEENRMFIANLNARAQNQLKAADLSISAQTAELSNRFNATNAGVGLTKEIITALQGTVNLLSGKITS